MVKFLAQKKLQKSKLQKMLILNLLIGISLWTYLKNYLWKLKVLKIEKDDSEILQLKNGIKKNSEVNFD